MPDGMPAVIPARKRVAITVVARDPYEQAPEVRPYRSGKAIRDALAGQRDGDG